MLAAASQSGAQDLPLKRAPRPTAVAISEDDLKTRLYIFADDSMMGRQFGREGNKKGTDYIAAELKRLGIEPAGENGTYFQALPVVVRRFTDKSELTVDGKALRWNQDFVAVPARMPRTAGSGQVVFGGITGDTVNVITREQATGKIVILAPAAAGAGGGGFGGGLGGAAARFRNERFGGALAVVSVDLDNVTPGQRAFINNPTGQLTAPTTEPIPQTPATIRVTRAVADQMLGRPLDGAAPGTTGATVTANLDFVETSRPEYGRNVIGVVRGGDPALRGQYLMISAHNDHVGYTSQVVDHDSAFVFSHKALEMSFVGKDSIKPLTPDQRRSISVNVDSLRKIRPARLDSIRNGADDDGSGSMGLLEIAEAIAKSPTKPRRSILFMWHTGEEAGLLGAKHFTAGRFTVPKDSIIAALNMDMIGRGAASDIPGGNPDFLGVVGSSFISNDLGEAVRTVNTKQAKPLGLDYRFDADVRGTLGNAYNNIYGRSDHFEYAKVGIPIAFFFTGLHADYHQVTDEPQYIDYQHYFRIVKYVNDLALELANRDKRPAPTRAAP